MKYWLMLQYDGTNYYGYASQPHKNTIQDTLEEELTKIFPEQIRTYAASRTDRFVHAKYQSVTFESDFTYDDQVLKYKLNRLLNNDLYIKKVSKVSDEFQVRFDVLYKEYTYIISKEFDVFQRNHQLFIEDNLDIQKMKQASEYLVGTHNFRSFCSKNTNVKDFVRTIYSIKIIEKNQRTYFNFIGNGFLYNMIRIIMGTLIEVGKSEIEPLKVKEILESQNRINAAKTVPAHGLYLEKISYGSDI